MNNNDFIVDDLRFYVEAFQRFDVDVSKLVEDREGAQQSSLELIEAELEHQLAQDAQHQRSEWIIKDRAFEAIGLIEADGPNIGINGSLQATGYGTKRAKKDMAFIGLVKPNRDRIVSQLEATSLDITAVANEDKDIQAVESLNLLKGNILDDNSFEGQFHEFVKDGVTYGSGVMVVDYLTQQDSPDLSLSMSSILSSGRPITLEEFHRLKHALHKHRVEHIDTFELIRYRGARGSTASDYNNPAHRWMHRVRQIPISHARVKYRNVVGEIGSAVNSAYTLCNPNGTLTMDLDDMVTEICHYVRFPVSGIGEVQVINPLTNTPEPIQIPVQRYAVAEITRLEGIGIVAMTIDEYAHNRMKFVNWVYSSSTRHSCGIGIVKYGRDAQVVHNKIHNSMLEFLSKMAKGGGFVDARLGLTAEDLEARSREGVYIPVKIPPAAGQNAKLADFVVDTRPSAIPTVFPELLQFHAGHVDTTMSVPNASKGIREGSSGRQELILQQQAEAVQSVAVSGIERAYKSLGVLLFSNIVQFEKDPFDFYHTDNVTGQRTRVDINKPIDYMLQYLEETGEMGIVPYGKINDITNIMFQLQIATRSVVPNKPLERAAFYSNFFTQTAQFIANPLARIWLSEMNRVGFRIPGIDEALKKIDEREQQMMQQQQEQMMAQSQAEQESEEFKKNLDRAKVAQKQQKIDQDYELRLMKDSMQNEQKQ